MWFLTGMVIVRDLMIRGGSGGAFAMGWNKGLELLNVTNCVVDSVAFLGKISGSGEPIYDSTIGVEYVGTASPHACAITITNCFIACAKTGVRATTSRAR
ncbi:hypothetical protein DBA29_16380 [Xenophilus aerolatus]|nr:hypothetical protein [Xenophilus aerolatus]